MGEGFTALGTGISQLSKCLLLELFALIWVFFTVNKFIVTAQKVLRLGPVFHKLTRKMNRVSFSDRINLTIINTEPRSAIELWY